MDHDVINQSSLGGYLDRFLSELYMCVFWFLWLYLLWFFCCYTWGPSTAFIFMHSCEYICRIISRTGSAGSETCAFPFILLAVVSHASSVHLLGLCRGSGVDKAPGPVLRSSLSWEMQASRHAMSVRSPMHGQCLSVVARGPWDWPWLISQAESRWGALWWQSLPFASVILSLQAATASSI